MAGRLIIFSGVYSFSGTTLLSAPYAVMEGGWISIIFLPLIALLASWSALLLGDCLSAQVTSYEGVGAAAFPQFGRLFIKVELSLVFKYYIIYYDRWYIMPFEIEVLFEWSLVDNIYICLIHDFIFMLISLCKSSLVFK